VAIRSSRRGALWAGLLLWPLTLLATLTTPGVLDQPDLRPVILIAVLAWPGLALLGAGLAPAALGSRVDAVAAGLALAIGAPIAAMLSTLISVTIVVGLLSPELDMGVGEALGTTIRLGVLGAVRLAPLVAAAVVVWVFAVRQVELRRAA
jgi:hypothetical protein